MSQVIDMDDLADRLGVLESIVKDLKEPLLSSAELEVVSIN